MQISQARGTARSAAKFVLAPVMRGNSLVVFEARNKVVRGRAGRATHRFEDAEVARLTRQLGELPQARVARAQAQAAADIAVHQLAMLTGQGADAYASIRRPAFTVDAGTVNIFVNAAAAGANALSAVAGNIGVLCTGQ